MRPQLSTDLPLRRGVAAFILTILVFAHAAPARSPQCRVGNVNEPRNHYLAAGAGTVSLRPWLNPPWLSENTHIGTPCERREDSCRGHSADASPERACAASCPDSGEAFDAACVCGTLAGRCTRSSAG